MPYESLKHKKPAVVPGVLYTDDVILPDFGTQQNRQVLSELMTAIAYISKDERIEKLVTFLLHKQQAAISVIHGSSIFSSILELCDRKTVSPFLNMTTASIFKIHIFFHCLSVSNKTLQSKTLNGAQSYCAGTLIEVCVHGVVKARNDVCKTRNSRWLPVVDVMVETFSDVYEMVPYDVSN